MAFLKFKVCRRISENIWHSKKLTPKQNTNMLQAVKKNTSQKQSDYSIRLQHMKKLSYFYGIRSLKSRGRSSDNLAYNYLDKKKSLLCFLETRLDVLLVRSNFCSTLSMARQLITHQKICVNFNVVDIPGFSVAIGDIIHIVPSHLELVKSTIKVNLHKNCFAPQRASHLEVNYKTLNAVLLYEPSQIHFPYKIDLDIIF